MSYMAYKILLFKLFILKQVMSMSKVFIALSVKLAMGIYKMNLRAEKKRDNLQE